MSDDDAKQYYPSTEAAFVAGQRKQQELAKQAYEEERQGADNTSEEGLTFDQIKNMSRDELIDRKPEVDKALEAMGKAGGQR